MKASLSRLKSAPSLVRDRSSYRVERSSSSTASGVQQGSITEERITEGRRAAIGVKRQVLRNISAREKERIAAEENRMKAVQNDLRKKNRVEEANLIETQILALKLSRLPREELEQYAEEFLRASTELQECRDEAATELQQTKAAAAAELRAAADINDSQRKEIAILREQNEELAKELKRKDSQAIQATDDARRGLQDFVREAREKEAQAKAAHAQTKQQLQAEQSTMEEKQASIMALKADLEAQLQAEAKLQAELAANRQKTRESEAMSKMAALRKATREQIEKAAAVAARKREAELSRKHEAKVDEIMQALKASDATWTSGKWLAGIGVIDIIGEQLVGSIGAILDKLENYSSDTPEPLQVLRECASAMRHNHDFDAVIKDTISGALMNETMRIKVAVQVRESIEKMAPSNKSKGDGSEGMHQAAPPPSPPPSPPGDARGSSASVLTTSSTAAKGASALPHALPPAASIPLKRHLDAEVLRSRFIESENSYPYSFAREADFHAGLSALLASPPLLPMRAMFEEHCGPHDFKLAGKDAMGTPIVDATSSPVFLSESIAIFTGNNYKIQTNSLTEWFFVYHPEAWLDTEEDFGYGAEVQKAVRDARELLDEIYVEWPVEAEGEHVPATRQPKAIQKFRALCEEKNAQLRQRGVEELYDSEFLAARLYTGPMYEKYNAVLNGCWRGAPNELADRWKKLCAENTYTATLFQLNSALVKLARLTTRIDMRIYRGISGGYLPNSFFKPDKESGFCGGISFGIMSFSANEQMAREYAKVTADSAPAHQISVRSTLLKMSQGLADRGADISWLSQYEGEQEVCFPALTGLQLTDKYVDHQCPELLVVEVRPSVVRPAVNAPIGDVDAEPVTKRKSLWARLFGSR